MAQESLVTVQNLTAQAQKCIWNGRIHVVQPYQVREFIGAIAHEFFAQRPGFVVEYKEVELPEPGPNDEVVWLANNTGNPFLPPTVKLKRYTKGKEEVYEEANPLCEPVVIRRTMNLGQVFSPSEKDPTSLDSKNLGNRKIVIPPYTRFRIGKSLAEWLLRRDGMQEQQHRGKLIMSKPPTDCEPNVSWSLTELQVFASILEVGQELLGPHEAEIERKWMRKDPEQLQQELLRAKQDLLYKLFFRLIDARYWQPSHSEFAEYLREAETQSLGVQLEDSPPQVPEMSQAAAVKAPMEPRKKRGRPPKKVEAQAEGVSG